MAKGSVAARLGIVWEVESRGLHGAAVVSLLHYESNRLSRPSTRDQEAGTQITVFDLFPRDSGFLYRE